MSQSLGVIRFVPPITGGAPAAAKVSTPSSIPDLSSLAGKIQFPTEISVPENETFHFTVIAKDGICSASILPLGWPGGCGPHLQIHLGDTGKDTLKKYCLDATGSPTPCQMLRCSFDGKGVLRCESAATCLTLDLNSSTYSSGLYLALYPAAGTSVKIAYSDSRWPLCEF